MDNLNNSSVMNVEALQTLMVFCLLVCWLHFCLSSMLTITHVIYGELIQCSLWLSITWTMLVFLFFSYYINEDDFSLLQFPIVIKERESLNKKYTNINKASHILIAHFCYNNITITNVNFHLTNTVKVIFCIQCAKC